MSNFQYPIFDEGERTRSKFAKMAAIGSASFSWLPALVSGGILSQGFWVCVLFYASFVAISAGLAWVLWPSGRRSLWIMVGRGFLVVLLSFLAYGVVFGVISEASIAEAVADQGFISAFMNYGKAAIMGFLVITMFGTIMTVGFPWILGTGLAAAFRDEDI